MARVNYTVDLDLNNSQLLNTTLQNLATPPPTVGRKAGFIYWNTADKTAYVFTGNTAPNEWLNLGQIYTHDAFTPINPTLSGASVLATLKTNAEGHITEATTRTITLADLGYTGAADANKYIHPTFTGNTLSGAPLTGALVISNVTVSTEGHVTGFSTRTLAPGNIGAATASHTHALTDITGVTATTAEVNLLDLSGLSAGWVLKATGASSAEWGQLAGSKILNDQNWVSINDALSNLSQTWSSSKIQGALDAINTTVTGALINKGGYNASTNTPLLDATPIAGIKNGWTYVVTAAGDFFTEAVQIGDMVIAKQDSPTTLAHWTVVNKNIPDIVQASTSAQGIVQLASQAEVLTGTDANKAVTAATLQGNLASTTNRGVTQLATQAEVDTGSVADKTVTPLTLATLLNNRVGGYASAIGNGALLSFDIAHNLNTLDVVVEIYELPSGETTYMQVKRTSANVVNIQCNTTPTTGQYRVVIKK